MEEAFVGIDVAFARRKRLPVCICVRDGARLHPLDLRIRGLPRPPAGRGNRAALDHRCVAGFGAETLRYLRRIERERHLTIRTVALDCPSAPKIEGAARRAAEVAMDRRRISCFTTPSRSEFAEIRRRARSHLAAGGPENRLPHANQLWMLVGFELFSRLRPHYGCREVFPQAIVAALGVEAGHKTNPKAYGAQLQAAAKATGSGVAELEKALESSGYGSRHDRLDAYLCAWVASLPRDRLEACGNPQGDAIWIPRRSALGRRSHRDRPEHRPSRAGTPPAIAPIARLDYTGGP